MGKKRNPEARRFRQAVRDMGRSLRRQDRIRRLKERLATRGLTFRQRVTLNRLKREQADHDARERAALQAEIDRLQARIDAFREALRYKKPQSH